MALIAAFMAHIVCFFIRSSSLILKQQFWNNCLSFFSLSFLPISTFSMIKTLFVVICHKLLGYFVPVVHYVLKMLINSMSMSDKTRARFVFIRVKYL